MKTMKFPIDLSMLTEEEIDQFRQDPVSYTHLTLPTT